MFFASRFFQRASILFFVFVVSGVLAAGSVRADSLLDQAISAGDSASETSALTNAQQAPPAHSGVGAAVNTFAPSMGAAAAAFAPSTGVSAPAPPARAIGQRPALSAEKAPDSLASAKEVHNLIQEGDPKHPLIDRQFKQAAAAFAAFCRDWEHKLAARESWNISRIGWRLGQGLESGTYTGYSPIKSCTTKLSAGGIPIGKLTYDEFSYSLNGKTIDEAMHAQPKQVRVISTLEIFRWDRNKWLY